MFNKRFPFLRQYDQKDCGPTCLRMIAKYYGRSFGAEYLNKRANIGRDGVSLAGIADAAEDIGINTGVVSIDWNTLSNDIEFPCIAYWRSKHFVVVYKIKNDKVYVADPAFGLIKYSKEKFCEGWIHRNQKDNKGIIMILELTRSFYEVKGEQNKKSRGLKFLYPYLKLYKSLWLQILVGLILLSVFQLMLPFLTQAIIDIGVTNQNLGFIYLVLSAQLVLIFSQTAVTVIRDWLLLYVTNKVNINLISDYLTKLMRLPLSFFDTKNTGDIMQRIQDNQRVQTFMSATTLSTLFSILNFVVFGLILGLYSPKILLVYLVGTSLYFFWSLLFMKRRAKIDYMRFDLASGNQTSLLQLITGMHEIKLNGSNRRRKNEWETIQVKLFNVAKKGLALTQYQNSGGVFINEIKNVIIIFLSASSVINGELTIGMMLAIQYIIGQLNVPITGFVTFARSSQDARLSINRLEEVYNLDDEEQEDKITPTIHGDVLVENLSFRYGESISKKVIDDISFKIPKGKVLALVGASGSGKTTFIKLLLKYYAPLEGRISIDGHNLNTISSAHWRKKCGVVMQDSYLFSGTIASNIAESEQGYEPNLEKVIAAAKIANIHDFVESLPLGYNTGIGRGGMSLSGGETQRVYIARAVYKNPEFLIFDEATSALDTTNEKIIMNNLYDFFKGRTVVIVAHRLSTVQHADSIAVLDKGKIIESGRHQELVKQKGVYFELVKNQLELGE